MKVTRLMAAAVVIVMMFVTIVFGFVSIPIERFKNAVHAYPPGTGTGLTLQDAYDYLTSSDRDAQMGTIGVLNRRTLILSAGVYTSTAFVLDTHYVDIEGIGLVIITDTSGAVIDCGSIITRISNITIDADSIANALTNDATAVCQSVTVTDGTNIQILIDGLSGAITYDQTNTLFSYGSTFIEMTEISNPGASASDIGRIYVRDAGGTTSIPYFQDAGGVETSMIGGAGATSLDAAYNTGSTIDVDTNPVVATVSDTDGNRVWDFVQNDITNNPGAILITNAGTGISLDIDGTSGRDIEGTGVTWFVTTGGAGTFTGLTTSSGATLFGDGTNTVAINSSSWDITTSGAASGITTLGMSGDLTNSGGDVILATGKGLKGSIVSGETVGVYGYDNDTGPGYKATILITNGNTIAAKIGTGIETIEIDSTTWDVSTAGVISGLTGLTSAGGVVNLNVGSNFAINLATGTSTGAVTVGGNGIQTIAIGDGAAAKTVSLGSSDSTSTTTLLSGSGGLLLNASNNQPTLINSGNSTGLTTIGNALSDISILGHIQGAIAFVLDGVTDNAFETSIAVTDPTADITWTFPDGGTDILAFMGSTHTTNYPDVINSVTGGINELIFEGSSANNFEAIITAANPTADTVWTLADGTGTVAFVPSTLTSNFVDIINSVWMGTNQIIFEGTAANTEETVITVTNPTADNTFTFADDSGLIAYTADGGKTTLSGAGAIVLTDAIVEWTTTGANSGTLADGKPGQILTVVVVVDGGEGTITPTTTATGWASVIMTDTIDTVTFLFADTTSGWIIMGTAAAAGNAVAVTQ